MLPFDPFTDYRWFNSYYTYDKRLYNDSGIALNCSFTTRKLQK